ncbi:hypothetical protein PhCBS80983_g01133 [Powellomyces hirtus]|uniref:Uncharacterized protein n=1 Tax=Powellomyces hirtus TaxID=109895 RepID=A0A507EC40_9FUNG|nr:hypothetical protein PhCBS80983_g01133 [Powellomyces hirtus]
MFPLLKNISTSIRTIIRNAYPRTSLVTSHTTRTMSSIPQTRNNTDAKEDKDPKGVSHNAGGNTNINASSGGTKSGSKLTAEEKAHEQTTAEKHWGTTQKYQTEEEAYGSDAKKSSDKQ